MRTIVDLTPAQLAGLDRFQRRRKVSRAAAVREAVELLIAQEDELGELEDVFGMWSDEQAEKARAAIAELRSEWER